MSKAGKRALHWLLAITMMIQPALFSYAMASMDHSTAVMPTHHSMSDSGHSMHHTMGHHQMGDQMNDQSHHQSHHQSSSTFHLDNCCHTPACGPALIVDTKLVLQPLRSYYPRVMDHPLHDVDLPVIIRPPRTLT